MKSTLIVLAHPDRRSVNGTWATATAQASEALGHHVMWSDLYAMQFDPVEKPSHYPAADDGQPFDVLRTQAIASASNRLPEDVAIEVDKIRKADRIVFHFPLWWFSPPAILKGWCDRVLVNGGLHSVVARFDQGKCRGRRALLCVTTGSTAAESAYNGKEGDVQMLLWPFAYTLRYLGFAVLHPQVVHGVHSYHNGGAQAALLDRVRSVIDAHAQTIAEFDRLEPIAFNRDSDFDDDGRLRPGAESYSSFIRQAH